MLGDVRVLDLTSLLPGPYCSLLLTELGAQVIKIESPLGDLARQVPPFHGRTSVFFASLNHSKRSIGLDLRKPAGVELMSRLVEQADVLLEGFRPGRAERLGIGSAACLRWNPRLIYCSLSGYGQTGPDRERAGHDLSYLARVGLLGLNRRSGEAPILPPVQIADLAAGSHAAMAVCAALYARERTGAGRVLDVSMVDSALHWMGPLLAMQQAGMELEPGGLLLGGRFPFYNVYRTADGGHVALATVEPILWCEFCRAVERLDLAPQQFADGEARAALFAELEVIFAQRTSADWAALIRERDLAAEVVVPPASVPQDKHLAARGALQSLPTADGEGGLVVGPAVRVREAEPFPLAPAPDLAADTLGVLREVLGLEQEALDRLRDEKVIFGPGDVRGRRLLPASLA